MEVNLMLILEFDFYQVSEKLTGLLWIWNILSKIVLSRYMHHTCEIILSKTLFVENPVSHGLIKPLLRVLTASLFGACRFIFMNTFQPQILVTSARFTVKTTNSWRTWHLAILVSRPKIFNRTQRTNGRYVIFSKVTE